MKKNYYCLTCDLTPLISRKKQAVNRLLQHLKVKQTITKNKYHELEREPTSIYFQLFKKQDGKHFYKLEFLI